MPLGVGTMFWGNTWLDQFVNPGHLVLSIAQLAAIVRRAVDSGVTFFDTAEGYGGGTSEERLREAIDAAEATAAGAMDTTNSREGSPQPETAIVGAAVTSALPDRRRRPLRDQLLVASKFLPTLWRWTQQSLLRACQRTNVRLGLGTCLLYFIHSPVHPLPLEWWVRACCVAYRLGLIRSLGLSNCDADQVRRAHRVTSREGVPLVANQLMFNLLVFRSPALQRTIDVCRELGLTVVGYASVGQGLLCERKAFPSPFVIDLNSHNIPDVARDDGSSLSRAEMNNVRLMRMTGATVDEVNRLRSVVHRVAVKHGCTMQQVAIRWSVQKGVVPLVGMRRVEHLDEALHAVTKVRLDDADVSELDAAALGRHTFEKPRWRRSLFVIFISLLMAAYKVSAAVAGRIHPTQTPSYQT